MKFAALCTDPLINNLQTGTTPTEWYQVVDHLSEEPFVFISQFTEIHNKVKAQDVKAPENISTEELAQLNMFKEVLDFMEEATPKTLNVMVPEIETAIQE